jgi:hypothetical protein
VALVRQSGSTPLPTAHAARRERSSLLRRPGFLPLFLFLFLWLASGTTFGAVQFNLAQGTGVTLSGARPAYSMNFGQVNGLGAGAFSAGLVVSQPFTVGGTPGALYMNPFDFFVKALPAPHHLTVTGLVTTNFTHAAALKLFACPINVSCTTSGNYSQIPIGAGAFSWQTSVTTSNNTNVPIGVGLWVAQLSGASAFTGTECATITFTANDLDAGNTDTGTLQICATAASGLRFVIATAGSAPNCSVADPGTGADYSLNLGNVNGLGIADTTSAAPCSSVDNSVSPPVYYTQYSYTASFTNFSSASATLQISRTTNFAKAFLECREAATAIGLRASTAFPETISVASAANGVAQTRFVGVAVTANNGAASSAGADSVVLTYTLTVP